MRRMIGQGKRCMSVILAAVLLMTMTPQTQMTAAASEQAAVEEELADGIDNNKAESGEDGGSSVGQAGNNGGGESETGSRGDDFSEDSAGKDGGTESEDGDGEEDGDGSRSESGAEDEAAADLDGKEETGISDSEAGNDDESAEEDESLSENDVPESNVSEDSVSENDVSEEDVSIMSLLAAGDNIDSGTYGNITWVVDANGKLTVEGTGEFAASPNTYVYTKRAPWTMEFNTSYAIKSAEIRVSGLKDAKGMFNGCSKLTNVSFAGSDLSSLENMAAMFYGCYRLETIDFGEKFDTGNVTNMSYLFSGCSGLESIDFGVNFNTENVTDMSSMFSGCKILKNVNVNCIDTKNATNMRYMLSGCENLGELNLSGWDTSKATDMSGLFLNCGFSKITLGGRFTTHSVTDMQYMFAGNSDPTKYNYLDVGENRWKLNGLDLACLDLSSVKDRGLYGIFGGCDIKKLALGRLDTGKTTTLSGLFADCDLTGVDFSDLKTDTITDMSGMFSNCKGTIALHTLDTENVTDMSDMFSGGSGGIGGGYSPAVNKLTSLDLSGLDTKNVTDMSGMFERQDQLTTINVGVMNTQSVVNMGDMFFSCSSLTSLDLSGLELGNVTAMGEMFWGCSSLKELKLGNLGSADLEMLEVGGETYTPLYEMFLGCSSLKSIDLSHFNFEKLTNVGNMCLDGCNNLTMIRSPYNVSFSVSLPKGTWYLSDGTTTTTFPQNLSYSVLLQKDKKPEATAQRLEASKKKTVYACGETVTTDDLRVMYYGTDGSVKKLAAGEYTISPASIDTSEPGEWILTVTYQKDGAALEAKVTLKVVLGFTAETTNVTLPAETYTYDGQPKKPVPTVVYTRPGGAALTLSEGTDYTVAYRSNIDAHEAENGSSAAPTVIIKGIGSYSGTVIKIFTIKKAAAPAAEEKDITASQCAQAKENRTIDLSESFIACGKKTGFEVTAVEDPKHIFSKTPVTADIQNGILSYGTNAAQDGDAAAVTVKVAFANYEDAVLTLKITMAAKKGVTISGIEMAENFVYSAAAVAYGGTPSVKAEDGTDLTDKVGLDYRYSGTLADGTAYPAAGVAADTAPVDAGSYTLTVAVKDDEPEYTGSAVYPFTISPAAVTVKANDLIVLMEEGQTAPKPTAELQFTYETKGLIDGDTLKTEPQFKVTKDGQEVTQINVAQAGTYQIVPFGADAGMNYAIAADAYENGILTVTAERVVYTVSFDLMGHGRNFTKGGIRSGSLLELTAAERTPEAEGWLFAGWYKDKSFAAKSAWNFETDIVQENMVLHACWLRREGSGKLELFVQEIPDLTYTGSALKPAVTVYDSDGRTLLKAGKDYTVKYAKNTNAIGGDGTPLQAGGTAKVTNPGKANETTENVIGTFNKDYPYVIITGKGNYTETIYQNFRILPAEIADPSGADAWGNIPPAVGFTLKYTDQFEAKANRYANIISSFKYKKALKADTDYTFSVQTESGGEVVLNAKKQLPLHAGIYTLTVTGKGNYKGTIVRKLYITQKDKLIKNTSITLGENQKTRPYTGEDVILTPGYYDSVAKKNYKVLDNGTVNSTAEENAKDIFLVKAGKTSLIWKKDYTVSYTKNRAVGTATMTVTGMGEYHGTKSVTFKINGTAFNAKTIDVKIYNADQPDDNDWKASMPYTGKAVTQNRVTLTTKVNNSNPTPQKLVYGEHYTISYKNNVKKGTATMTFTAKPESGYSGSFKKNFKIGQQYLSEVMLFKALADDSVGQRAVTRVSADEQKHVITVKWDEDAIHSKGGASLSFTLKNAAGMELKQGTDYTVSYKDHKAVTKKNAGADVTPGSKQPVMTIKGKGNYAGTLVVQFQILPAAITSDSLTVTAAQVQKKTSGIKFKEFKLKVMDGKAALKVGTDYTIDESGCTSEIIQAYADSLTAGTDAAAPKVVLTGIGNYETKGADGKNITREIPLAQYIYTTKFTAKNIKVEVTGDTTYTGQNVEPSIKVSYYKDNNAKRQGAVGTELTAGKDYTVTYGSKNVAAGKNKGSITVIGAGNYGGSVKVKFEIKKKPVY